MPERKTVLTVCYQYKPKDQPRPVDAMQEEELSFEAPYGESVAALPIPAVGDSVVLTLNGGRNAFKVVTRHFSYLESDLGLSLFINIVVTDLEHDEYLARIKE